MTGGVAPVVTEMKTGITYKDGNYTVAVLLIALELWAIHVAEAGSPCGVVITTDARFIIVATQGEINRMTTACDSRVRVAPINVIGHALLMTTGGAITTVGCILDVLHIGVRHFGISLSIL
jgi:hypothetical protein